MKQAYFIFLLLITFSCSSNNSNLYEINPERFTENKLNLSDIADDITYIPLDNSIPLSIIFSYKILSNSVFLSAKGIGILKFDREGKLIQKIGSRGRGPGEFSYGMKFTVDEKTGNVFVLDPGIVKVYSQSGNFLRDIKTKEYSGGFGFNDIETYNSLLFFPDNLPKGDSKYNWVFLDTLGNLISKKNNSVPTFETNIAQNAGIYKFEDKLFYFNLYNDTVFSISPDLSYRASFIFSQGEYRWPKSTVQTSQLKSFESFLNDHLQIRQMFETKHFLVLIYSLKGRWITLIDKQNKKTFKCSVEYFGGTLVLKQSGGIFNDVDGGRAFQPENYFVENGREYLVGLINPYQLITHVESSEFKNLVPKYPEKKKDLEKLANSLKETDNPVLMIVRLKK